MEEERYMKRALELALRGRGHTVPNPVVGAVIVKDGTKNSAAPMQNGRHWPIAQNLRKEQICM